MTTQEMWEYEFALHGFKLRKFDWCSDTYFEFRGKGVIGFYDEWRYCGYIELDNLQAFNKQSQCCMRLKLPKNPNSRAAKRFWKKFYSAVAQLAAHPDLAARSWGNDGYFLWED